MNVTWNVTFEMDREYGTDYRRRLKDWIIGAQEKHWSWPGAHRRQRWPQSETFTATEQR